MKGGKAIGVVLDKTGDALKREKGLSPEEVELGKAVYTDMLANKRGGRILVWDQTQVAAGSSR